MRPELDEVMLAPGEHAARVYRFALRKGTIDAIETVADDVGLDMADTRAAIDQLVACHLLNEQDNGTQLLTPVDPSVAAAVLVLPVEREIHRYRERIARIREGVEVFRPDYAATNAPEAGWVDQVTGEREVCGYLRVAADACRSEIMVLRSNRHDGEEFDYFDDFLRRCPNLSERGVRIRVICPHRSRADLITRIAINDLHTCGVTVRTVGHVPRAAVIVDRSLAVLLGHTNGEATASRVRDAGVVHFLLDVFDHLWDVAAPLDAAESGYAEATDDLRQTIASLMANGLTDEVLARKLGMSVRSCRRHIAALLRDLDAVSRFQAGVRAAHRNLVRG